jgi:hypothetical protein
MLRFIREAGIANAAIRKCGDLASPCMIRARTLYSEDSSRVRRVGGSAK